LNALASPTTPRAPQNADHTSSGPWSSNPFRRFVDFWSDNLAVLIKFRVVHQLGDVPLPLIDLLQNLVKFVIRTLVA